MESRRAIYAAIGGPNLAIGVSKLRIFIEAGTLASARRSAIDEIEARTRTHG